MGSEELPPVVPYLTVVNARRALEFCVRAFGAETVMLLEDETGVYHARARIAGGIVMLFEEATGADEANRAPGAYGGSPVAIRVDLGTPGSVDETASKAVEAGATLLVKPTDRPWGRLAEVRDPEGHIWRLAAST